MDFDRALEICGNFGKYQYVMLFLFGYTNILSSFHYFSQSIITFTPEHWCDHTKLAELSPVELRRIYANVADPACTRLDDIVNGTAVLPNDGHDKCHEWIYDREDGYESVTTELNWVCDEAYRKAVGQSLFFVGSVMGTIFFGFLADKIGRLPALIMSTLAGALGDFLTSFVHTLPWFAVMRFISGLATDTMIWLMYIIVFEYLSPMRRTFGLNIMLSTFYCFGLMISPWLAIWVGTWRKYLWIASLPSLGVLVYPFFLAESAQWQMTKRKFDGAVRSLKRVAAMNGRKVDESVFSEFVKYYDTKMLAEEKLSDNRKDTFMDMFRTPRLRKFTILLIMKSMIITLSYDIISRNVEGFGSSPFKLFSYTSFSYLPAGLTLMLFQNIIGRKGMAFCSLLFGGMIITVTGFLLAFLDPDENAILLAIMVGLGRYVACVSYDAEAQYAAEIIPTSVRGRGIANIHVMGYAFSFLSAYIIYLANYFKPMPSIIVSLMLFLGAALCLLLPETMYKKLPETISDGEQFGLNEKWYFFTCFQKGRDAESKEATRDTPQIE